MPVKGMVRAIRHVHLASHLTACFGGSEGQHGQESLPEGLETLLEDGEFEFEF